MNLGVDIWCRGGLVTTRLERGRDRAINRVVRRVTTPRGRLYFHPDFGVDLANLVGLELGEDRTRRVVAEVEAELRAEPVLVEDTVRVEATETTVGGVTALDLQIRAMSVAGPLDFVVTVDAVTLSLIGVRS